MRNVVRAWECRARLQWLRVGIVWVAFVGISTVPTLSAVAVPSASFLVEWDATLANTLSRGGLSAEALTAAGVEGSEVSGIVSAARTFLAGETTTLEALDQAVLVSRQDRDRLTRSVRTGIDSEVIVPALEAARLAYAADVAARDAFLEGVFDAATGNCTAEDRARLELILAHRGHGVPVEYLVVTRTDAEWVALREALAAERIAVEYEEEALDSASQSLLATCRAASSVATARACLDNHLASMASSWDLACSSSP